MTTISGTGRMNSSAWSETGRTQSSARAAKMFAKVDADGSGSVDTTELQGMLDHIAEKSGQSLGSADELMTKMDADGNGSLSQTELDAGMKSLMPAPSSTVDFAQQSQGMPPPPPPSDGDAIAKLFSAADTDGDHTISQSEADTLQAKMDAVVQGLQDGSNASSSSSSTGDASGFSLSAFVDLVLKQYAQGAAASAGSDTASSLSVSA